MADETRRIIDVDELGQLVVDVGGKIAFLDVLRCRRTVLFRHAGKAFEGVEAIDAPHQVHGFEDRREFRSEEHTSELQSLMRISYAVFCLKKKKKNTHMNNIYSHVHTIE